MNSGWHCNGIRLVDVAGNSRNNNTFKKNIVRKFYVNNKYTFNKTEKPFSPRPRVVELAD